MDGQRAVFLDRDGVLNEDPGYVGEPEHFHIFPFAGEALQILKNKGFLLFVVTNQSGVARGYFTLEQVHHLHEILKNKMRSFGVEFAGIFVSPDHPDFPSETRKPSPKFVLEAAQRHGLDLTASYVIGDMESDLEMARRAGCRKVLVRTGKGRETEQKTKIPLDFVFDDLLAAAKALQ